MSKTECLHDAHGDDQAPTYDRANVHPAHDAKATDPVCGMHVNVVTAEHVAHHNGHKVYFCSVRCKEKFESDPEIYAHAPPAPEAILPPASELTYASLRPVHMLANGGRILT